MTSIQLSYPSGSVAVSILATSPLTDKIPPFVRLAHEIISQILFQLHLLGLETTPWTCNQLIYPLTLVCRHLSAPASRALYHAPSLGRFDDSQSFRDGWEQHRAIIRRLALTGICPKWIAWFEHCAVFPCVSEAQVRNDSKPEPQAASINIVMAGLSICIPNVENLVLDNFEYAYILCRQVDYITGRALPTFCFHKLLSLELSRITARSRKDSFLCHSLLGWILPTVPALSEISCVIGRRQPSAYDISHLAKFPNLRRARIFGDGSKPYGLGIGSVALGQLEHLEIDDYYASTQPTGRLTFEHMANLKSLVVHRETRYMGSHVSELILQGFFPVLEGVVFGSDFMEIPLCEYDEPLNGNMVESGFAIDYNLSAERRLVFSRQ